MKETFKNSTPITQNSQYNYEVHGPIQKTQKLPTESNQLILETKQLKLALGNLFEAIVVFFTKLNSRDESFEQVAILEAKTQEKLHKKTNLEDLIEYNHEKIKGGIRCDIFQYLENTKTAQVIEIKWGKSKTTIQKGFETYPQKLIERFQNTHNFEKVEQFTVGIMPFKTEDFETQSHQKYICFPLAISSHISKNTAQKTLIHEMVTDVLNPEFDLTQSHILEFKTMINLLANQNQILDFNKALLLANNIKDEISSKDKITQEKNFNFKNNITQKINCLLLEFTCMLSRIEDEKDIPGKNIEILKEVEYLTEIINNLSNFTNSDLSIAEVSKIYQILFIGLKKFKIEFENHYFENTNNPEDYFTKQEEQEYQEQIRINNQYIRLSDLALETQNKIFERAIQNYNFRYTNFYELNFLNVSHQSHNQINQSNQMHTLAQNQQSKISVIQANIDIEYRNK